MLIRSQDKTCLTNMAHITDIYYSESRSGTAQKITAQLSSADTTHLGTYSTEEKAIKVLDMIEKSYVETVWTDEKMIIVNRVCFEMPQDEEVKL